MHCYFRYTVFSVFCQCLRSNKSEDETSRHTGKPMIIHTHPTVQHQYFLYWVGDEQQVLSACVEHYG